MPISMGNATDQPIRPISATARQTFGGAFLLPARSKRARLTRRDPRDEPFGGGAGSFEFGTGSFSGMFLHFQKLADKFGLQLRLECPHRLLLLTHGGRKCVSTVSRSTPSSGHRARRCASIRKRRART